ncbi:hypothetical protein G7Y89_g11527 [Cudoniella acicularis]|uniref:Uncharacterized protein n=1 Tax=Cudoniella acicularis TaxID=354080 RepID=A0A8H4RAN7_9HELO|nr:hypothetical protein G7Y89_g11527 [Cudoniella acicularis]
MYGTLAASYKIIFPSSHEDGTMLAKLNPPDIHIYNTRQRGLHDSIPRADELHSYMRPRLLHIFPRCEFSYESLFFDTNIRLPEDTAGLCTGADTSKEVVFDAYAMCNGQKGALPNTHATIVATLVAESSSPSIWLVQPATTTSSSSQAAPTSTFITSTRPASTSATPTSVISTMTALPSTQNTTQTAAPAAIATPMLTKSQIVGISVASVGGAALAFAAILIFSCLKRRNMRRNRDSDELPFQLDPTNYAKSIKSTRFSLRRPSNLGPGGSSNGVARKMKAPPIPPRLDTMNPNMFSRSSIIGLAISPEKNTPIQQTPRDPRHSSKLLPPKPTLKLQMPPQPAGYSFSQTAPAPPAFRSSVTTQFEEDGVSPYVSAPKMPSLQGAGLSYPKPTFKASALSRQSTGTQFEEDEEVEVRQPEIAELPSPVPLSKFAQFPGRTSSLARQSTATAFEEDMETIPPMPRINTAVGPYSKASSKPSTSRKSTATQFEEDDETAETTGPVRDTWGPVDTDEQLDTAIDHWRKFSPINPTPGPQFFVPGDTWGLEPRSSPKVPEHLVKPLRLSTDRSVATAIGRGVGSFSQPRRPNDYPRTQQKTALDSFPRPPQQVPQLSVPNPKARPGTGTSVYTTRTSSVPTSAPPSPPPTTSLPPVPKSYQQAGPYDGPKTGNSLVSLDSRSSGLSPRLSPGGPRTADLSPIIDSPASGRSPLQLQSPGNKP